MGVATTAVPSTASVAPDAPRLRGSLSPPGPPVLPWDEAAVSLPHRTKYVRRTRISICHPHVTLRTYAHNVFRIFSFESSLAGRHWVVSERRECMAGIIAYEGLDWRTVGARRAGASGVRATLPLSTVTMDRRSKYRLHTSYDALFQYKWKFQTRILLICLAFWAQGAIESRSIYISAPRESYGQHSFLRFLGLFSSRQTDMILCLKSRESRVWVWRDC